MGNNAKTTAFLKECMADSLIKLIPQKPFEKITVDDITKGAGVHRTTWFRNFSSKNEAITFKTVLLWNRWADERMMKERSRFTLDNAKDFFEFSYEIRQFLQTIHNAGLQSTLYDAFYQIMMPLYGADAKECYEGRFYSYGLFGLQDEWVKRGFCETPDEMVQVLYEIFASKSKNINSF